MENGEKGYNAITRKMVEVGDEKNWSVTSVFEKLVEAVEGEGKKRAHGEKSADVDGA